MASELSRECQDSRRVLTYPSTLCDSAAYKESKPKRAMSAYMFFVKDNRLRICQENPDLKFADIGKLLGQVRLG